MVIVNRLIIQLASLLLLLFGATAQAAWFDGDWQFRRSIDVNWEAEKATGDELAEARFYTAGHHKPNAQDVRIASVDGKLVPFRILRVGPGDRIDVAFALVRGVRKYYAYFGGSDAPTVPKSIEELPIRSGLLMEMRRFGGGGTGNFKELEKAWARNEPVIGCAMIDRPFLGVNPFGEQPQTMSKLTGSLFAPVDGEYQFAAAARERGAIYIDGNPLLFIPGIAGDTRFNATMQLKRGRHDFGVYLVCNSGEGRISVGWRRPDMAKVDIIPAESFGVVHHGKVGPLEEVKKTLTADFKVEYLGEAFFAGNYSHRVRITCVTPKTTEAMKYEWDFGDGQTSTAAEADHVYLTDGVYPVRLTVRIGGNSDTQTTKVSVTRQYERLDHPLSDEPPVHAKIVASYNIDKMPLAWLPWAARLSMRTRQSIALLPILQRMAAEKSNPDPRNVLEVMGDATREAMLLNRAGAAMSTWDRIPQDSNLQPAASREHAKFLLWWLGDFQKAAQVLKTLGGKDPAAKLLYAQALVLDNQLKEGAAMLQSLPVPGPPERQAALSGALARTIEYYITEGDWETGEDYWERWQTRHPADFLDGYSVLLKTKLMELKHVPSAAAKIAEAFAVSVPNSSYAPQLLDRASKLLAGLDPAKSQSLRQLLKQRYPEDPLSQDSPGGDRKASNAPK